MGDRGFPKKCICGETIELKMSRTAKNPGKLFFACPNCNDNDNWYHLFKWTDMCVMEEIEELRAQIDNLEGDSLALRKGLKSCQEEICNLDLDTSMSTKLLEKEIQDIRMQIRILKNLLLFGLVLVFVLKFLV